MNEVKHGHTLHQFFILKSISNPREFLELDKIYKIQMKSVAL
jgi:hypothetical protein